jgi:predicted choloylglycine hydrolase
MSGEPFPVHVVDVELPFRLVDAGSIPGGTTAAEFVKAWPSYRYWFLHEGEKSRPSYSDCRAAIASWMPELLADYDALVDAVGGGDLEARFLSHWCPPPLVAACSIAMIGGPYPMLIRNYDYPPSLCDALALRTHWSGRTIVGMSDCGWGLMDGMNDAGLAIAITFGGRRAIGHGFGIGLVVRYLLQVCSTAPEAVEVLARLPVQMSYNVAMIDASGEHRMVFTAPDRPDQVTTELSCANRQGSTEWPEHAAYCNTVERELRLDSLVRFPLIEPDDLVTAFLRPPLYRSLVESTWGTVYTAAYAPTTGAFTLLWPDDHWPMSVHGDDVGQRPRQVLAMVPEPAALDVRTYRPAGTSLVL